MGDKVKKFVKHWFMICKQQIKIEAKYSSVIRRVDFCKIFKILLKQTCSFVTSS